MTTTLRAAAFALAFGVSGLVALPAPTLAAGDSGSSQKVKRTKKDMEKCKRNRVWSERRQKCVRPNSAELTDDQRYETGRDLAYAGEFDAAITFLKASDQSRARTLNMLGFSHRKAGHIEEGMRYYQAALAVDPNYTLARSYMGLGLLDSGDRDGAEEQLALIKASAGTETREYRLLADALHGGGYRY